jgi:hypothetical protein
MKKYITKTLFVFSILIPCSCLLAQTNVDSLKSKLDLLPNDTASIHNIIKIANGYGNLDLNAQIAALEVAEEKTLAIKDPALLCKIYIHISNAYIESSKTVEASNYLLKANRVSA